MEKREQRRVRKRLGVRFGEGDLLHSGFTRDVSASGAFVICGALPAVGTRLRLEIQVEPGRWLSRTALVRRVRQVPQALRHVEHMGFGVSFVTGALPGEAPTRAPAPLEAPKPAEVFEVRFSAADALQAAWQRELRLGGLLIATERPVPLDQPIRVRLRLDFARLALELPARVVQVLTTPAHRLAVVFEDLAEVRRALSPHLPR